MTDAPEYSMLHLNKMRAVRQGEFLEIWNWKNDFSKVKQLNETGYYIIKIVERGAGGNAWILFKMFMECGILFLKSETVK